MLGVSKLFSKISCVTFLLVGALVLAACGGVSKAEYQEQMRSVGKDMEAASNQVASMKPSAPPKERAKIIHNQAVLLSKAAEKAGSIDVPKDAQKPHAQFVKALTNYAKILDELATASGSANASERQAELLGDAGEQVKILMKASKELSDAGYEFNKKK